MSPPQEASLSVHIPYCSLSRALFALISRFVRIGYMVTLTVSVSCNWGMW